MRKGPDNSIRVKLWMVLNELMIPLEPSRGVCVQCACRVVLCVVLCVLCCVLCVVCFVVCVVRCVLCAV